MWQVPLFLLFDLRGGFPRVLVRVSTGTGTARRARRPDSRDHQPQGELDLKLIYSYLPCQWVASCGGWAQRLPPRRRREGGGRGHYSRRGFRCDRHLAGLAGFVAQQTINAGLGKALLPAPHRRPSDTDALRHPRCAGCRSAEASTVRARSTCLRGLLRSATIAASRSRSTVLRATQTL